MLKLQMALEDNFREIAERCSLPEGRHAVLLMDRGTMDVLAYVGKDAFDDVFCGVLTRGDGVFMNRLHAGPRGVQLDRPATQRPAL